MSLTDQSYLVRLLRGIWKQAGAGDQPRAPLLTFAMVAPSVRGAWIGRWSQRLWIRIVAAATASRVAAEVSRALDRFRMLAPAARIAQCAWLVAIAALTNLMLLTVVEQYHFPRRTALVLPAVVAVAAVVVIVMSSGVARALADKRDG